MILCSLSSVKDMHALAASDLLGEEASIQALLCCSSSVTGSPVLSPQHDIGSLVDSLTKLM